MFNQLFNNRLQDEMTNYFLNNLSKKGILKTYKKGMIIDPENSDCIYIVVDGMVSQELISEDGRDLTLFMLSPGTIFGEMDYFDGYRTCSIAYVIKNNTKIAILDKSIIDQETAINPKIYNYLIHSITRKYRIVMLKLAENSFNDFRGKLVSTIIRFAIMEEGRLFDGARIKNISSITALAKYLSCSRSTLSTTLTELKDEGLIETEKNHFIIKDSEALTKYVNFMW